jgi:hypothetical protein
MMADLYLGWPQITLGLLMIWGSARAGASYGEPKKPDTYDAVDVLIGPAITAALLYFGGFWTVVRP